MRLLTTPETDLSYSSTAESKVLWSSRAPRELVALRRLPRATWPISQNIHGGGVGNPYC